jgi:vacuolar protein sorting-associated protein 13A/C
MLHTSVCLIFLRFAVVLLTQTTADLPGGDGVALLTASRVLTFGSKRLRLTWDLPLSQVQRVINEDRDIRFAHKAGKDHDKYLFIEDKGSQAWFYEQIAGVVKSFNARRRMDS